MLNETFSVLTCSPIDQCGTWLAPKNEIFDQWLAWTQFWSQLCLWNSAFRCCTIWLQCCIMYWEYGTSLFHSFQPSWKHLLGLGIVAYRNQSPFRLIPRIIFQVELLWWGLVLSQCLKITQNVPFEFWHFPPKTDLSGNTVWPQAWLAKLTVFGIF